VKLSYIVGIMGEMRAGQKEMKTNQERLEARIAANQESMWTIRQGREAKMDNVMDFGQDMMKSHQERMEAYHQRTKACQEERWAKIRTSQDRC
jgi:hypothetical protein